MYEQLQKDDAPFRWRAGTVKIRSLPHIPATGLTKDDLPALMAQCHRQMQACIVEMDAEIELSYPHSRQ